jgi:2-C-methyl-D-erythritol 4-phosphate cytidylyltransferase
MPERRKWSFLIPAAGDGIRLGLGPKAFLEIAGKTMLARVMANAAAISGDVVVGVPAGDAEAVAAAYPDAAIVAGGGTRQETIEKLLERARHTWVMIHDVARPLCSPALIEAVAEKSIETGAAAAFCPVDVPVAIVEGGRIKAHYGAREARLFQSPLAFRADLLRQAYRDAHAAGRLAQSTVELVVASGYDVRVVEGERTNIKITTDLDLALAQVIAARADDA